MPTLFAIGPGLAPVADFPVGSEHEVKGCPDIVAGETHRQLPGAAGQVPFLGRHLPALQRVTRQDAGRVRAASSCAGTLTAANSASADQAVSGPRR